MGNENNKPNHEPDPHPNDLTNHHYNPKPNTPKAPLLLTRKDARDYFNSLAENSKLVTAKRSNLSKKLSNEQVLHKFIQKMMYVASLKSNRKELNLSLIDTRSINPNSDQNFICKLQTLCSRALYDDLIFS